MEYKDLTEQQAVAQSLNIHQGVFKTGKVGRLLSDKIGNATIQRKAQLAGWRDIQEREDNGEEIYLEDIDFTIADKEDELLGSPIDGYHEISSIFIDSESRANEMIEFLNEPGTLADDASFGDWSAPPCDSAARGLFWGLKNADSAAEKAWVIEYLQDKIDNKLF